MFADEIFVLKADFDLKTLIDAMNKDMNKMDICLNLAVNKTKEGKFLHIWYR